MALPLKIRLWVKGTPFALCEIKFVKSGKGKATMGRFARDSQTIGAGHRPVRMTTRPQFAVPARTKQPTQPVRETREDQNHLNSRAPVELKYFVLALAALVGLGVGWLSGKAITGWLTAASPPLVLAERAAAPIPEATSDASLTEPRGLTSNAASPPAAPASEAAGQDSSPAAGAERRVARRAHIRRQARGNLFFRPFRALRKLRIW
jgi:hypothetical protein